MHRKIMGLQPAPGIAMEAPAKGPAELLYASPRGFDESLWAALAGEGRECPYGGLSPRRSRSMFVSMATRELSCSGATGGHFLALDEGGHPELGREVAKDDDSDGAV